MLCNKNNRFYMYAMQAKPTRQIDCFCLAIKVWPFDGFAVENI